MRIKIISCNISGAWYAKYVGYYFSVVGQDRDFYLVREPEGYKNIVDKNDAQVMDITWRRYERVVGKTKAWG